MSKHETIVISNNKLEDYEPLEMAEIKRAYDLITQQRKDAAMKVLNGELSRDVPGQVNQVIFSFLDSINVEKDVLECSMLYHANMGSGFDEDSSPSLTDEQKSMLPHVERMFLEFYNKEIAPLIKFDPIIA